MEGIVNLPDKGCKARKKSSFNMLSKYNITNRRTPKLFPTSAVDLTHLIDYILQTPNSNSFIQPCRVFNIRIMHSIK